MLFYFKMLLSRHAPQLASKAAYVGACAALTAGSVYYTNRMTDPEEKEIVLNNFLDPDACRQELNKHRRSRMRE